MRTRTWMAALVAVGCVAWFGGGAFSEEEKPAGGAGDPAEMEKMMQALATPGEMHRWLAKFDGAWDVKGKMHGPDGSVTDTSGTAKMRMVLGGRFSEQSYSGSMWGGTFEGHGLTGYNNLTKQFENYWFDTLGTTPSIATGACNADGTRLELSGEWAIPGGKMPFKFVTTWTGANAFTFEMLMDHGTGSLAPMGTLHYTRK